ncbi:MAG TPA: hypothetical protein VIJ51_14195 [Solirubrobacteraceae bacterium]
MARPSDSFVDSVGINIHSGFTDTAYADQSRVISLLQGLGIRHVRDEWENTQNPDGTPNGKSAVVSAFEALHAAGIGVTALVDDGTGAPPWGLAAAEVEQRIVQIAAVEAGSPGIFDGLEGPNEWDGIGDPNWAADDLAAQKLIFDDAQASPGLEPVPVIAPSVIQGTTPLPSLAGLADEANLHYYPGTAGPETLLDSIAAAHNPPGSPLVTTETGYTTGYVPGGAIPPGVAPVDEAAQATYLPRLLAEAFGDGSRRTFIYELLDTVPGSGDQGPAVADNANQHFGLVGDDYSPKPAYAAVQRLLALLAEPSAPTFTPGTLTFEVRAAGPAAVGPGTVADEGPPAAVDVRTVLLERSDGTFQLLVWRADADVFAGGPGVPFGPRQVPPLPVTIDLLHPVASAAVYVPNAGPAAIRAVVRGNQVSFPLGADLAVVDLTT